MLHTRCASNKEEVLERDTPKDDAIPLVKGKPRATFICHGKLANDSNSLQLHGQ